nr:hypothetical protein [Tanacetum cinerariifolium]
MCYFIGHWNIYLNHLVTLFFLRFYFCVDTWLSTQGNLPNPQNEETLYCRSHRRASSTSDSPLLHSAEVKLKKLWIRI